MSIKSFYGEVLAFTPRIFKSAKSAISPQTVAKLIKSANVALVIAGVIITTASIIGSALGDDEAD